VVLLTLKEISERLGVPPSTLRYRRDRWPAYIPTVVDGRHTRYRPEALEVFAFVGALLRQKTPAAAVEAALAEHFPMTVTSRECGDDAAPAQRAMALALREETRPQLMTLADGLPSAMEAPATALESLRAEVVAMAVRQEELLAEVKALRAQQERNSILPAPLAEPVTLEKAKPGFWRRLWTIIWD
jgi:DNA-binding transcriptional MerR regulator